MEFDGMPKLTFDELRTQVLLDLKMAPTRTELLKTLYFYSKDSRKHSRIIKVLFWALIVPLLQQKDKNKTLLFALRTINQLIQNESSHEHILGVGRPSRLSKNQNAQRKLKQDQSENKEESVQVSLGLKSNQTGSEQESQAKDGDAQENDVSNEVDDLEQKYIAKMNEKIEQKQNPLRILIKIIAETQSTQIMIEATKAVKNLAKNKMAIEMLMNDKILDFLKIFKQKFNSADSVSQEFMMETISLACQHTNYQKRLVEDEEFIKNVMQQAQSISISVTYFSLKVCRQLSKFEENLERMQGNDLRLSVLLIYTFRWLDTRVNQREKLIQEKRKQKVEMDLNDTKIYQYEKQYSDLIFREIAKTFENILKFYDLHARQLASIIKQNQMLANTQSTGGERVLELPEGETNDVKKVENEIIGSIVQLGRQSKDPKTTLNAATALAHITEVLNCNENVASDEAVDFMIDMLKDTKNLKHHRQGCRYFANLSFYKLHREKLIEKDIATFLLKAIDGHLDEDTIKHSAIAMANLSSHKDFMKSTGSNFDEGTALSKAEKWKIKPLIHLLDSAKLQKINLIQAACITLCNMASKPSLHKHFVHEPEISTIKNCLLNPIDKGQGKELTRFIIKLVCNLTKNPETLSYLLKKGFLEILFDLLSHQREKEIFGNVVTAISYLSMQKEAQEKIIKQNIIVRILEPLTTIHEVDQKMIIIALTSMLFNGIELQREFINNQGLSKLMFFLQQPDKIFYQLACKCFSLLSENEENLNDIIEQESLNTIIISCLRTKDIDLETLKEILKIFVNLILWRKLKKENIEVTCALCDIGLMVDDLDMNILAIFCLNVLAENSETHKYILKSGINVHQKLDLKDQMHKAVSNPEMKSIFSRINFLLEQKAVDPRCFDSDPNDSSKSDLLVTLMTSFYLNLARNDENRDFLLKLRLFQRLTRLMESDVKNGKFMNKTALCYTNTIFAKLLKYHESRWRCIEEGGHMLFIKILQDQSNINLFLETLDTIKLFLTKREYLVKFKTIPDCLGEFESNCEELDVSIMQVLAILSFEKDCHESLKKSDFLEKLQTKGIFKKIFEQFEQKYVDEPSNRLDHSKNKILEMASASPNVKLNDTNHLNRNRTHIISLLGQKNSSLQNAEIFNFKEKKTQTKHAQQRERTEELTLSISIILSNLSNDPKYIEQLLGVDQIKKLWSAQKQEVVNDHTLDRRTISKTEIIRQKSMRMVMDPTKDFILKQKETQRLIGMINLISHENPFISEQIAILLANVSNSDQFKYYFISEMSIKSLIEILRFHSQHLHTEVSLLAVMISVLNLSAIGDIITGVENTHFLHSLQEIININNQSLPFVYKSVGLLAISNIYTFSDKIEIQPNTQAFALESLKNWQLFQNESKEEDSAEVIKNLVYASLILFYNILQKNRGNKSLEQQSQHAIIKVLIEYLTLYIIGPFDTESQIINIILELITLFTRDKNDSKMLFNSEKILSFVFDILKGKQAKEPTTQELSNETPRISMKEKTLNLASLAFCRLSQRLEENMSSKDSLFIQQLEQFDHFEHVLTYIQELVKDKKPLIIENQDEMVDTPVHFGEGQKTIYGLTLEYIFIALENISYFQQTRDSLNSPKIFQILIQLFTEEMPSPYLERMIIIMYNLQFNLTTNLSDTTKSLTEPPKLPLDFLKLLKKTYKSLTDRQEFENNSGFRIQRKIMSIIVVASANPENHQAICQSKFYNQLKYNINKKFLKEKELNEEIELYALVNIALNKNLMPTTHKDLKKIHKLAAKGEKIDFKTKVDLFVEISKYAFKVGRNKDVKEEDQKKVEECIKAMVYTLVNLTAALNEKNFMMYKYFLTGILECTRNMQGYLNYLTNIKELINFLRDVLKKDDFKFENNEKFDDKVLHFSLKMIVCEIFFYLKFEKEFFKMDDISESVELLIQFAQSVLQLNIEKKTQLVSNTLRLLCQMISSLSKHPEAYRKIQQTKAIEFVTTALNLSKSMQPCINIDALFCLNNMMNIKAIALDSQLRNLEVVHKAIIIYLAYQDQADLDEPITTFLYSISKYTEYFEFMQDKLVFIFTLLKKQIIQFTDFGESSSEACRQKILATIHNLSDNEAACKEINMKLFIKQVEILLFVTIKSLRCTVCKKCREPKQPEKKLSEYIQDLNFQDELKQQCLILKAIQSKEMIHELALQTLINLFRYQNENVEEIDLMDLLSLISVLYKSLKPLARQFSLRLVTLLTRQWNQDQIQKYKKELIIIISEFIECCQEPAEIQLVIINLEKISLFKKLMSELGHMQVEMANLVTNIANFLRQSVINNETSKSHEQLMLFLKKLSKYPEVHQSFIKAGIPQVTLDYIKIMQRLPSEQLQTQKSAQEKQKLKDFLETTQNVMKMIRNLHEAMSDQPEQQQQITTIVTKQNTIFDYADRMLEDENLKKDDELAVTIVKIIICFNSIQDKMDNPQLLKKWLSDFSKRFILAANSPYSKKNAKWYMEKYIYICELLITKYLSIVSKEMSLDVLEIYKVTDTSQFTKNIWYKMLKILAHLQQLMDILNQPAEDDTGNVVVKSDENLRQQLFQFILLAYKEANKDLCFLYFMKVTILLTRKCDVGTLYKTSQQFQDALKFCDDFFQKNYKDTENTLVMEIILYLIDFFKFLMNFDELHQYLKTHQIVARFIEMLKVHRNPQVVRSLSAALQEISKFPMYFPELLGEDQIGAILNILAQPSTNPNSLDMLVDTIKKIMQQTKVPIKYLIASKILLMIEEKQNWDQIGEDNVVSILRILHYITENLDNNDRNDFGRNGDESVRSGSTTELKSQMDVKQVVPSRSNIDGVQENFNGLRYKSFKYSFLAITNLLRKCDFGVVLKKNPIQNSICETIFKYSAFERDTQINLRVLYLMILQFKKTPIDKEIVPIELCEISINFLLNNIFKFRKMLSSNESCYIDVPEQDDLKQLKVIKKQSSTKQRSNKTRLDALVDKLALDKDLISSEEDEDKIEEFQQVKLNKLRTDFVGVNKINKLSSLKMPDQDNMLQVKDPNLLNYVDEALTPKMGGVKRKTSDSSILKNQITKGEFVSFVANLQNERATPKQAEEKEIEQLFFFEEETYKLTKINAIKLSLCMSLKVLYKLSKKKNNNKARMFLIDRPFTFELFRFFEAYVKNSDQRSLKQIKYVLNIINNCSEIDQSHINWKQFDTVPVLFEVLEKVIEDDFNPDSFSSNGLQQIKNNPRKKLLLPILQTFVNLSRRNGITELQMYFGNPSKQELIHKLKEEADEDIREQVNELLNPYASYKAEFNQQKGHFIDGVDIEIKLQNVISDNNPNKNELLKDLEQAVLQSKMKQKLNLLEQIPMKLVRELINFIAQFVEKHQMDHEDNTETVQRCLRFLVIVYQSHIQELSSQTHQIQDQGLAQTMSKQISIETRTLQKSISVFEEQKTFIMLFKVSKNCLRDAFDPVIEFCMMYSKQANKRPELFNDFILPTFEEILSKDNIDGLCFRRIIQTLIYMQPDQRTILDHEKQPLPSLLLALIKNKDFQDCYLQHSDTNVIQANQNSKLIELFDHLIRLMFLSQIKLSPQVETLVKTMLESKSVEIQKLAISSCYCLVISLQEVSTHQTSYLNLLVDDAILMKLVSNVKMSLQFKENLIKNQKFSQMSQEIEITNMEHDKNQIGVVSLQIVVLIVDHIKTLMQNEKSQESMKYYGLEAMLKKIFFGPGVLFILILLKLCLIVQLSSQISVAECRLFTRIFASLPPEILKEVNVSIFNTDFVNSQNETPKLNLKSDKNIEISLQNIFQSLANILHSTNDTQVSYFAIFTLMNIVNQLPLKTPTNQNKYFEKAGIKLAPLKIQDMDFQSMTAVLCKTGLMTAVLKTPMKPNQTDEILRICMKFLIVISFKAQNQRILIGEPLATQSKMTENTEALFNKLHLEVSDEKTICQAVLKQFIEKLNEFQLTMIHNGTYVQFIHLISQILMQATTPVENLEEKQHLLPTTTILMDVMQSFCHSMDPKVDDLIHSAIKAPENAEGDQKRRQLLHKFFFFNYTFQMIGDDVTKHLVGTGIRTPLDKPKKSGSAFGSYKFEIVQDEKDAIHEQEKVKCADLLYKIFSTHLTILETLKERRKNNWIDLSIKPSLKKEKEISHNLNDDEILSSSEESNEVITLKDVEKDNHDDENQSTSLSIVKMTLFNLNKILDHVIESDFEFMFNLKAEHIESVISVISEIGYEENGDVVESSYQMLEKLLKLSQEKSIQENVNIIDQHRVLAQAVKHASVYQCCNAYTFLRLLVRVSDKYKEKEEMESALEKIEPPELKKKNIRASTKSIL